jgi:hypothetical protein
VDVVPDGAGKVRVTNAGGNVVENAMPGTELTVAVTPGLGYYISSVTAEETDDGGVTTSNSLPGTPLGGGVPFSGVYEMPAKQVYVTAEFTAITGVAKVAYVSEEGWNDGGYSTTVHTADSWGTASRDLQAVINSWTGTNFTEVWVQGTMTPKSRANMTIPSGTWKIDEVDITGDNKNLAFVIPPGLKIYGGFRGTEARGSGSGQFPGPISANAANDKRDKTGEDWRLRSVLNGELTGTTNAYHVVIMTDIPDDQETVLDGLTISGGVGADSAGTINFRTYTGTNGIDKQSGAGLYLVNASPVLNNLRVENNKATANSLDANEEDGTGTVGGGGGIYNLAVDGGTSSPRLTNTVISDNLVMGNGNGAGMYNEALNTGSVCSPILSGVTIMMNQTSGSGGGIVNRAPSTATCAPEIKDNSVIRRNIANNGAGVYNFGYSAPTFTDMEIRGNIATNYGGGVMNNSYDTRSAFTNVSIIENSASGGAGILTRSYYLTMTNVTISGNKASDYGGGLANFRGGVVLTNVLIKDNTAKNEGGGIFNEMIIAGVNIRSVIVITNGVIRNNTAGSAGAIYNNYGNADNNFGSYQMLRVALTNVLIADNTVSGNGGGIHNSIVASPGKGIDILLNNVTITGNTANIRNNNAYGGGGIYTPAETTSGATNPIQVIANNSVIWGNNAPNNADRANIYNPTRSRLTLNYSLAPVTNTTYERYENPGSTTTAISSSPFMTVSGIPWYPINSYTNTGSNALYPANADALIGETLDPAPSSSADDQAAMTARKTLFKALIEGGTVNGETITGAVFGGSPRPIDRDAAAAVGNAAPAGNARIQGTAIDVGAYENQ